MPSIDDKPANHLLNVAAELAKENAAMDAFMKESCKQYVLGSRKTLFYELLDHSIGSDCNGYVCLTGPLGSGKTALLAYLCKQLLHADQFSILIIPHFVGASPSSTSVRRTLRRLCYQLKTDCPPIADSVPEDFESLRITLISFLSQVCKTKSVLIVLDDVHKFQTGADSKGLWWLPTILPFNARLIISCSDGPALQELRCGIKPREIDLPSLTLSDGEAIIDSFGKLYGISLKSNQRNGLLNKSDAGQPLYLLTVLKQLQTLSSSDEISVCLTDLPSTSDELFSWLLDKLIKNGCCRIAKNRKFDSELSAHLAALLAASRYGLSQTELTELFDSNSSQSQITDLLDYFEPFLIRRGKLLDFYHRQFRVAVKTRFLNSAQQSQNLHQTLAHFFRRQSDPALDSTWMGDNPRALNELPYHLIQGQQRKEVEQILSNRRFIEAKILAGQTYELIDDLDAAIASLDDPALSSEQLHYEQAMLQSSQTICNTLWSKCECFNVKQSTALASPQPDCLEPTLKPSTAIKSPTIYSLINAKQKLRVYQRFIKSYAGSFVAFSKPVSLGKVDSCSRMRHSQFRLDWLRKIQMNHRQADPCLRILKGHRDDVESVAITSDGKVIASAGGSHPWEDTRLLDKTVRLWNAKTGECLAVLEGHWAPVSYVTLSKDGEFCLSASLHELIKWDVTKGMILNKIEFSQEVKPGIPVARDMETVFVMNTDYTGRIRSDELAVANMTNGQVLKLGVKLDNCHGLLVTPNARWLLSYCLKIIEIISLPDCTLEKKLAVQNCNIVAATPDLRFILTGTTHGGIDIWENSGRLHMSLEGHQEDVTALCITPNGQIAVSGSRDQTLRVWDLASGRCIKTLFGHRHQITALAITPDGSTLVSAARDQEVRIWKLEIPENNLS